MFTENIIQHPLPGDSYRPGRLPESCDRSEDGGKLSGTATRLVFRLFEANSGNYLTKINGKIGQFATAAVGQSALGQPPRSQSGVSLLELVVFIVVVSIALGALFSVFNHAMINSVDPMIQVRALECAQAKMDEVIARKFDENTPTGGVPACGSAETGAIGCNGIAVDAGYDDIGDYNGQNFVDGDCDVDVAVIAEGTDLGLADDASLVRLITVTSNMPDGNTVRISAYRTNF